MTDLLKVESVTANLKNKSNSSSDNSYLTLNFDKEDYLLPVDESINAILTLHTASNSLAGSFNFEIVISGTG